MRKIPDGISTSVGSYLIVSLNYTVSLYVAEVVQEKPLVIKISDYHENLQRIYEEDVEDVNGQFTYLFQQSRESAASLLRNLKANENWPLSGLKSLGLCDMTDILTIEDIKYPTVSAGHS